MNRVGIIISGGTIDRDFALQQLEQLNEGSFYELLQRFFELQGYKEVEVSKDSETSGYNLLMWDEGKKIIVKCFKRVPMVKNLYTDADGLDFALGELVSLKEVREFFSNEKKVQSLCFFPEGTRSINGELQSPNMALIKLAYKMNVPVVPAAINGTINVLPKGKMFIRGFKKVTLEYTEPILPSDYPDSNSFSDACWQRVENTYNKLISEK